jgi:CRP-like cAMP-binding protein
MSIKRAQAKPRLPEIKARTFDRRPDIPANTNISNLLTPPQQARLRSISTVLEYRRPGSTVFSEGEDAHFVYCVSAGVMRISRYGEGGRRQVLAFLMPGDFVGLPDSGIYMNSAETVSSATVFRVPWRELKATLLDEPELQLNFLIRVAFDLRQAQRRILILGQQNVTQRLASLLLDFTQHPDFYDCRRKELTFPVSRFDVGDYLGTAPETIARAFTKLESMGLIKRLSPRSMLVRDPNALRNVFTGRRRSKREH